jgi:hypothetical protein
LLFGTGHRIIGRGAGGVMPDRTATFSRVGGAGPGRGVRVGGAASEVVVGVQPLFLSRFQWPSSATRGASLTWSLL